MFELVSNSWWEKIPWRSFRIGSTLEVGRGGRFETWDGSSDTIHDIIKEQGTPEVGLRLTRYPNKIP